MSCESLEKDLVRLQELLPMARQRAQEIGSLSGLWDVILDGECLLKGERTLLRGTREAIARKLVMELERMTSLAKPLDARYGKGVRILAWVQPEPKIGKRQLLRALGIRARTSYPVQARVKGESLVVRMEAHYSPYEKQSKGALRSYLERPDAAPDVLQEMVFEQHLDRWSIWINPSENDVNPYVAIHALEQELEKRFGIAPEDTYCVQHHDPKNPDAWHLHVMVPAREGMKLDNKTLRPIGDVIVRDLVLDRAVERALDPARQRPVESGWDLPATEAQRAVLNAHGRAASDLTRGDASLAIEAITGERSWYPGRER